MLVNHPQMQVTELPKERSTWSTLPTQWGRLLVERMGPPMTYSKKYLHWYAKLDGHPIHVRQARENLNHMWIEHIAAHEQQVAQVVMNEINNGTIIQVDIVS